jgi:hypothetical protein
MMMAQLQNDQRMLAQINAHHYSGEVIGHRTEKEQAQILEKRLHYFLLPQPQYLGLDISFHR